MWKKLQALGLGIVLSAAPLAAQEPEPPGGPVEEPTEEHDFQFALAPSEQAAGAAGQVLVFQREDGNDFTVEVTGLPEVDTFDAEGRDVAGYTVWVVPSRERVQESTLAGVLEVNEDGTGRFEGTTELADFGIILMATPTETSELSGVPVLTGIPEVRAPVAPETVEPPAPIPAAPPAETPDPGEPEQRDPQ